MIRSIAILIQIMDKDLIEKNYGFEILGETLLQVKGKRLVYKITIDKGNYIVKVLPKDKVREKFQSYIYAFEYIYQNFPNIPQLLKTTNNQSYIENENSYIYVIKFIEGQKPNKSDSTYFINVGKLIAEFHSIPYVNYKYESDFTPIKELPNLIKNIKENLKESNDEKGRLVLDSLDNIINLKAGRQSIIHTDIFDGNIIKSINGKYYLIDLDDAGVAESLIDIGYFVAHSVIQFEDNSIIFSEENLKLFLKSYTSVRPLLKDELDNLVSYIYFGILTYIYDWDKKILVYGNFLRLEFVRNNEQKLKDIIFSFKIHNEIQNQFSK